jgi:hypothetical protein
MIFSRNNILPTFYTQNKEIRPTVAWQKLKTKETEPL